MNPSVHTELAHTSPRGATCRFALRWVSYIAVESLFPKSSCLEELDPNQFHRSNVNVTLEESIGSILYASHKEEWRNQTSIPAPQEFEAPRSPFPQGHSLAIELPHPLQQRSSLRSSASEGRFRLNRRNTNRRGASYASHRNHK